jgi:2-dehydropantoate 2-reductase
LGEPFLEVNKYHLIGLANALNEAGIPSDITDNIAGYIWAKALYNCALNPLSAILSVNYGKLADDKNTKEIMEEIIREIYVVAKAKGIKLLMENAEDYISLFFNKLIPPTKDHHSSMYQDLRAKRQTEIDAMNATIVKYAKFYNIKAPMNMAVTNLIKFREDAFLS